MSGCYQPNGAVTKISKKKSRSYFGLPEKKIILSSFNNDYKIGNEEFNIWCEILKAHRNCILWLLVSNDESEKNLSNSAKNAGIKENQIKFGRRISFEEHLERIKLTDIALDTFNYNSHTTGSDYLRHGVPFVSKIGKSFPARVGASLLNAIGLQELICDSQAEYKETITHLISDPSYLKKIKAKLKRNISKTNLFNPREFARELESAYSKAVINFLKK